MALNYLHSDFRFVPIEAIALTPSSSQLATLARLRNLVRAFGSCSDTFDVPSSGRRTTSLIGLLTDLGEVLTWEGAAGDGYQRGFQGAAGGFAEAISVPRDLDKADELRPYRDLDPARLKITGTASWCPQEYLSDSLWLAYVEPASLIWTNEIPVSDVPTLSKEKYDTTLQLAKLWDVKGLLFLRRVPDDYDWRQGAMRFFNNYKAADCDRMIGDRRRMNWREGRIPGVSRALPNAHMLSVLEVCPRLQRVSVCISDRRDFYHQFKVTEERAASNAVWPLLKSEDVFELRAFDDFNRRSKRQRYDRRRHGDGFGFAMTTWSQPGGLLQPCFCSLPQGDHLGVEFATDAHRNLLSSRGLLSAHEELRSDSTFRGTSALQGLVIDDFFSVAVQDVGERGQLSKAVKAFKTAKACYEAQGLMGSDAKDVIDADQAKIIGGEIDSSEKTRALGVVTLASPVRKRLALAFISLELAQLPSTTDVLHACLIGGWVHSLLYRRQFMSVLDKAFSFVNASEIDRGLPRVVPLTRAVAQEIVLLSVLCPLFATDLGATLITKLYASDASDRKGAYVSRDMPEHVARAMWRSGRKKGGYVRMLNRSEALIRKLDPDFEELSWEVSGEVSQRVERPRAHRYHFIELCGGAGKVTKYLSQRGWVCGPVLDLDASRHYNLRSLKLLSWVIHLLEDLLDSFMVEPPCTTFSPAQHPASRGYDCPRGYEPLNEKTLEGTELALRALTLIYIGARLHKPGLLEQPRKSKMRKLEEWIFLVLAGFAEEQWTASCAFGSPHQKEFVFLCTGLPSAMLHRKCSRDHQHVPIQGVYTKPSAVYTDELACVLAQCFHEGLKVYFQRKDLSSFDSGGLEMPLCNDLLVSGEWKVENQWAWNVPCHINVQETSSVYKLLKQAALCHPSSRFSVVMDSNVGLSALVKGRSPSHGLRKVLRRSGAVTVAGGLYPAYHFGPTRINIADCPTRDNELPVPCQSIVDRLSTLEEVLDFASVAELRRPKANWVRLFMLVHGGALSWKGSEESWKDAHLCKTAMVFSDRPLLQETAFSFDFDASLGFPGEGPSSYCRAFMTSLGFWIFLFLPCHLHSVMDTLWILPCRAFGLGLWAARYPNNPRSFWGLRGLVLYPTLASSMPVGSHGPQMLPRDVRDKRRAEQRSGQVLPIGRPVLGQTQFYRERLLDQFSAWLKTQGLDFDSLVLSSTPDVEGINLLLEKYGRALYNAGRPYNHYAELINGVASKKPVLRRQLQAAWDLAYAWLRLEPPTHHVALPWQALLSLLTISISWGWLRVAGVIALSWGGITRIGEVLNAFRKNLILPSDLGGSVAFALLEVAEPKTRFSGARHQSARLDQPQLLRLVDLAFAALRPEQRLWPMSGQTMRLRFQKLLTANGLADLPPEISRGIDLGSLRAGGASWLLLTSEDSELTRRRGRWLTSKTMEVYVQESASIQFLPRLPTHIKQRVLTGAEAFPWALEFAEQLYAASSRINLVCPIQKRDS